MKKIICILLTVLMLAPVLAACSETPAPPAGTPSQSITEAAPTEETQPLPASTPTPTPETPTETPTPEKDPMRTEIFDKSKFYKIETVNGDKLQWNSTKLSLGKAIDNEGEVWSIDNFETAAGRSYSVFFAADSNRNGISMGSNVTLGGKVR